MEQNGADHEGIWGFLAKDIEKCVQKCASAKCFYCGEKSATITCKRRSCKRNFHSICGFQHNCLFQFSEQFDSYCHTHHGIKDKSIEGHDKCMICWELMGDYHPITSIPSCCRSGWFHAICIRKAAIFSGYMFSCPLCGHRKDEFLAAVRNRGIYVPMRDAAWELSQNAYGSLLFQYRSCDAKKCFCPNGRDFAVKRSRSKWFLLKCIYCGSKGIHFGCSSHDLQDEFKCTECTSAHSQAPLSQESELIESQKQTYGMSETPTTTNECVTDIVDLTVDENSNESELQPIINASDGPSKSASAVQYSKISSSIEDSVLVGGDAYPLVSVVDHSDNIFKERTIILANDVPPPGTQFQDDHRKLSRDRINLLLFR